MKTLKFVPILFIMTIMLSACGVLDPLEKTQIEVKVGETFYYGENQFEVALVDPPSIKLVGNNEELVETPILNPHVYFVSADEVYFGIDVEGDTLILTQSYSPNKGEKSQLHK